MLEGCSSEKEKEHFLTSSIPCESAIKKELNNLLVSSTFASTYKLVGYNGLKTLSLPQDVLQQKRLKNYQSVRKLFEYSSDCVPDMSNGHSTYNASIPMRCTIERCLMLTSKADEVIGAVYFRINLATRRCLVANLAVSRQHQSKRLGSFLWYSAVLTSILYGCKIITGCSLNGQPSSFQLKKFYERCGCQFRKISNNGEVNKISILNLENENSLQTLLKDFATLSSYDIASLIEQLQDNKENQKKPNNNLDDFNNTFLHDLWGFLKETDPDFNLPHAQFKANSLPLTHHFDLQIACDKKEICYSIESEKLVKKDHRLTKL